jgi:hydrogenase maturation protease
MNEALVERIVNAVLYEGYILYPYRPSMKNRQRWTFGGLCPRSYSEATGGSDPWSMQTECLVEGDAQTVLQVRVRFLHLLARRVGELEVHQPTIANGAEPAFHFVESLQVGDKLLQTWQEAVEREVTLDDVGLGPLVTEPRRKEMSFPASRSVEQVRGPGGDVAAVFVREQQPVAAVVTVAAEQAEEGLFKVRVRIENHTPLHGAEHLARDDAMLHALVSTHTILGTHRGAFVSLMGPPGPWRAHADACCNIGTWPVLVGQAPERDTLLSSPITLYDYPEIAQESPGDLYDATEIDELLTLCILTMTDEEKEAAAAVDDRTRALLQRTESLAREQLCGLHGAIRGLRPVEEHQPDA